MPDGTHRQVHLAAGSEVRHYKPIGWTDASRARVYKNYRACLVGAWQSEACGYLDRRWKVWREARFSGEVLPKSLTRFEFDWEFNGQEAIIQSRATDETGHVQPTYVQYRAVRGNESLYHNNAIQSGESMRMAR